MSDLKRLNKLTVQNLIKTSSEKFSDLPSLVLVGSEPVTFKEVGRKSLEIAFMLQKMGLKKGSHAAILSENIPNWGISYFAVSLAGCVVVPILPDFAPHEVENIIKHADCEAVFVSEKLRYKVNEIDPSVKIILIDDFSIEDKEVLKSVNSSDIEFTDYEAEEDDIASIIYTSGTTGQSKGVMLTNRNVVSNAVDSSPIPEMVEGDRMLSILPLSHTYECSLGFLLPVYIGAAVYYLGKPPTPTVLLPALVKVKPVAMLSVPLLIEKIYRQKILKTFQKNIIIKSLYSFPPVRKLLNKAAGKKLMKIFGGEIIFYGIGGAKLAADVEKFLQEAHFPYAIGYGLTETSPLIAGDNAKNTVFRSTGRILQNVNVRIDNPDPETGVGEIVVKGPNVMKGYYKNPELTKEVFTEDGWFKTGDLGILNEKGYLYIKGRIKNLILGPSGENIYPESIEGVINSCDFVEDSVVFDSKGKIVALVQLNRDEIIAKFEEFKKDAAESKKQFQEFLSTHLADVKKKVNSQLNSFSRINEMFEQTDPFEKTPTKKIKRFLYINKKEHKKEDKKD